MSDTRPSPSRSALTAVTAVAATTLMLLLAVWAASIGPNGVFEGSGPSDEETSRVPDSAVPTPSQAPEPPPEDTAEDEEVSTPPGWLSFIAVLSQITTGLVLVYAVFRALFWLRRRLTGRGRREARPPAPAFETLEEQEIEETVDAVMAGAEEQREILLRGEPRNAIVECWHRFEVQAERAGARRESWETSAEFTLRMLDRISADPGALAELAGLYREARFSEHVLDEIARARAVEALDRIHAGLSTTRAVSRPPADRRPS